MHSVYLWSHNFVVSRFLGPSSGGRWPIDMGFLSVPRFFNTVHLDILRRYVCETEPIIPKNLKVMTYGLQLVIQRPLVSIHKTFGFVNSIKAIK